VIRCHAEWRKTDLTSTNVTRRHYLERSDKIQSLVPASARAFNSPLTQPLPMDVSDEDLSWALFAGIVAANVLSRGIARAGSKEGPFGLRRGGAEP
jgi:hypothetical protein